MHCLWFQPICNVHTQYAYLPFVGTNTEEIFLISFSLCDENSTLARLCTILFYNAKKKYLMIYMVEFNYLQIDMVPF